MAKLHHRKWETAKTWCGRGLKTVRLAKRTSPDADVCGRCGDIRDQDDARFRALATESHDAIWRVYGRLWP